MICTFEDSICMIQFHVPRKCNENDKLSFCAAASTFLRLQSSVAMTRERNGEKSAASKFKHLRMRQFFFCERKKCMDVSNLFHSLISHNTTIKICVEQTKKKNTFRNRKKQIVKPSTVLMVSLYANCSPRKLSVYKCQVNLRSIETGRCYCFACVAKHTKSVQTIFFFVCAKNEREIAEKSGMLCAHITHSMHIANFMDHFSKYQTRKSWHLTIIATVRRNIKCDMAVQRHTDCN